MRSVGVVILAFVLSGFVAGIVQLQLAIWFGSQEEFIVAMLCLWIFVIVLTIAYGVALGAKATAGGADRLAIGMAAIVIAAVVAIEVAVLIGDGAVTLAKDVPILVEIAAPALLAILIQWWLIRRRIVKRSLA